MRRSTICYVDLNIPVGRVQEISINAVEAEFLWSFIQLQPENLQKKISLHFF